MTFAETMTIGEAGALCILCWRPCDILVQQDDVVLWRCRGLGHEIEGLDRKGHAERVWDERHTTDKQGVYHAGPVEDCPAAECRKATDA